MRLYEEALGFHTYLLRFISSLAPNALAVLCMRHRSSAQWRLASPEMCYAQRIDVITLAARTYRSRLEEIQACIRDNKGGAEEGADKRRHGLPLDSTTSLGLYATRRQLLDWS